MPWWSSQFEFAPRLQLPAWLRPAAQLPDRMKVWRVQDSPGQCARLGSGFAILPMRDLALGLNRPNYGDVGIGRQANVLQWGYGDPPSRMTEAGRRLFLNCIHYIRRFDGQAPLVRRECEGRRSTLQWAPASNGTTQQKLMFVGTYPQDVMKKYERRADELNAYYVKNPELLYWDQGFRVDDDLKSLGPNPTAKSRLCVVLSTCWRTSDGATARQLLDRYTDSFETPQQWRQWFRRMTASTSRMSAGKFRVVPRLPDPPGLAKSSRPEGDRASGRPARPHAVSRFTRAHTASSKSSATHARKKTCLSFSHRINTP
jgi:hypothetical protein